MPPAADPGGWRARWGRAPSWRRWARSATPSCATPSRCRPGASWTAEWTCLSSRPKYDLLGAKAAINGCRRAMAAVGREVPLQVQVTIEMTGRMLPGTEIGAALAALAPLGPAVFGLNCATGPAEMGEHLRVLSEQCPVPVACIPNAGLPQVVDGRMHYDVGPDQLADYLARYVTELGVSVIGGCCGTTPEHLAAVIDRCADLVPGSPARRAAPVGHLHLHRGALRPKTPRFSSWASAPTPTAPGRSATPCWKETGTAASRSPATRWARAPTCWICAWTTWAATAPTTWTSWPGGSPPGWLPRWCSTPPNPT